MNFRIEWDDDDREWVGTCEEYPSLSWLHVDRQSALDGIRRLAYAARDDIEFGRVVGGEPK